VNGGRHRSWTSSPFFLSVSTCFSSKKTEFGVRVPSVGVEVPFFNRKRRGSRNHKCFKSRISAVKLLLYAPCSARNAFVSLLIATIFAIESSMRELADLWRSTRKLMWVLDVIQTRYV
jgi:hypothetical protein